MSSKFIQSGNLSGTVSSTGTLQGDVNSSATLSATVAAESTLQGNISDAENLQAEIVPEATLGATLNMPQKVAVEKLTNAPKISEVTLLASAWQGSGNLHYQLVNIEGTTENSQVDLTPSVEQLLIFYEKDIAFVTENENGIITVYAIGQKPANDYTIQVTITEVNVRVEK
jgi:hypothetical protein